jgi:hypothetical protein
VYRWFLRCFPETVKRRRIVQASPKMNFPAGQLRLSKTRTAMKSPSVRVPHAACAATTHGRLRELNSFLKYTNEESKPNSRATALFLSRQPSLTELTKNTIFSRATEVLEEQGYLCRGCGVPVAKRYVRTFRYCAYFGAFFCTSCHAKATSIIPANVVQKWNFKE